MEDPYVGPDSRKDQASTFSKVSQQRELPSCNC